MKALEPEFVKAMSKWLLAEVREQWGKENRNVAAGSYWDGLKIEASLRRLLPSHVAERVIELAQTRNLFSGICPHLTETEIGTIMQAGASRFIIEPQDA